MRYLVALAALFLSGCTATIDRPQPAPTPVVVYVRDEAAIADARNDGTAQGLLVAGVMGAVLFTCCGVAVVAHTRTARPPVRHPTPVTYATHTHNHLHIHAPTAAQVAVRKMLDEVQL